MAHIEINKNEFERLIGTGIEDEKLEEEASYLGVHWNRVEGVKWDVEVYPNRPDLLSVEGLARAYSRYFGIEEGLEEYKVSKGGLKLEVEESVEEVRPVIGAAVVRDLELDERAINGLIQLQEKIHETLGRRRDKLAIGLHDLSELEPPFTYRAVEPEKVSFTPLEYDRDMDLGQIVDEHEKGQEYAWILEDEEKYPIIEDSKGQVLSFPPIINNQLTEVDHKTTDIFIDVTGKDQETVKKALNILSTALSDRGGELENLEVGEERLPKLEPERRDLDIEYLNSVSGLDLSGKDAAELLESMGYGAKASKKKVDVDVPCYRTDIMHSYDLIEDIVIAYRYNNIEPELPEVDQIGSENELEEFSKVVREALIGSGALETHTFTLSSKEKLFDKMELDESPHASMANALTEDYEVVRSWMTPSIFEVLKENRHQSYPQTFFEVGEVVEMPEAENKKKICYLKAGNIDYTEARKALQVLENALGLKFALEEDHYEYGKSKRSAKICLEGEEIGYICEFKEKVADNWGLDVDVSGFELDLENLEKSY
ncbi:MAG: phenylalanine--tRNA ligase subunit beta [Candidatus Nanohaloarchaea archaeon]